MNELENRLHDALHTAAEARTTSKLSGPALRRTAARRTVRARTGGFAVVGAAAVAGVVVAPGLIDTSPSRSPGAAGQTASPAATTPGADPSAEATAEVEASATPAATAQPVASSSAKPTATPGSGKVPGQDSVWSPAGTLIADPTVLAHAPQVAATDAAWTSWGGTLLAKDTVHVVYADSASFNNTPLQYPRPIVIVTGRTSADSPTLRIAVMTTIEAGADKSNLDRLTMAAMTTVPADGPQAIAISDGMTLFVAAEAGVDNATYTYRDNTGDHTADMTITDGVAIAAVPMDDLKNSPNGAVTDITATSHGKVIWDAAPVVSR